MILGIVFWGVVIVWTATCLLSPVAQKSRLGRFLLAAPYPAVVAVLLVVVVQLAANSGVSGWGIVVVASWAGLLVASAAAWMARKGVLAVGSMTLVAASFLALGPFGAFFALAFGCVALLGLVAAIALGWERALWRRIIHRCL